MGIKEQILDEIALKKRVRGSGVNLKAIAKDTGLSYNGLLKWRNEPERSIGDKSLDKIAKALGKRIILINRDI